MNNLNSLRFFYGSKEEYRHFISNNQNQEEQKQKMGYFFVVFNNDVIELYLGEELIVSSNTDATIVERVKTLVEQEMNNYVLKNSSDDVVFEKDLIVQGKINAGGTFSANNFLYDENKNAFSTSANIDCGNIKASQVSNESTATNILHIPNIGTFDANTGVAFENNVSIILPEILEKKDSDGKLIWSFNTQTGELMVNKISVVEKIASDKIDFSDTTSFESIQIGNILLQAEHNDLKITSVNE